MNIDKLAKDYQALKAPPGLLQNVQAELAEQDASRIWWPGWLGATATAAALILVFMLGSQQPEPASVHIANVPSLSTLSKIKLKKPKSVSTSLANIRNVSLPSMPARPVLIKTKPGKEGARINNPQENDDVYT